MPKADTIVYRLFLFLRQFAGNIVCLCTFRTNNICQNLHNGKRRYHDKESHNPPEHMILALVRTGRVRLSVFQERDEPPNEIDERDHESQDDQRIEDIVTDAEH